ncbi:PIN domain-containing protein [Xylanimonas ulmi]|uniref:PIN domain-containing protein n=1 Tax=Xylanimonas ulmi TaxID=228973 RepID=A0A4Q7M2H0_9MICO|nr:PIN domain-containing protein [Xylanibacterium ulmi]RZS60648.1 PIN domain-containing protein [Xylanibacterium ulmi]
MARLQRVFIDTSELFPFTIMDVLLTLSEDLLFTWVWTDDVLDEWEHVIVREGQRSPQSAKSVTDAVRTHFGRHRIDGDLYDGKITEDLSPDPGDRNHAAACVYGDVDVLVTRNVKHYRSPRLTDAGVEVVTADAFLCALLVRHPSDVLGSVVNAAARRRNPPTTFTGFVERLERAGATQFAHLLLDADRRRRRAVADELSAGTDGFS